MGKCRTDASIIIWAILSKALSYSALFETPLHPPYPAFDTSSLLRYRLIPEQLCHYPRPVSGSRRYKRPRLGCFIHIESPLRLPRYDDFRKLFLSFHQHGFRISLFSVACMSRCRHHAGYDLFSLVRVEDDLGTIVIGPSLVGFLAGATLLVALRRSLWRFSGGDAIYDFCFFLACCPCPLPFFVCVCV